MFTPDVVGDAARMLAEIDTAVQRGDLAADRGERDRLRGASLALAALVTASESAGRGKRG